MKILGVTYHGIRDAEYDSTLRVLEEWWQGRYVMQERDLQPLERRAERER